MFQIMISLSTAAQVNFFAQEFGPMIQFFLHGNSLCLYEIENKEVEDETDVRCSRSCYTMDSRGYTTKKKSITIVISSNLYHSQHQIS